MDQELVNTRYKLAEFLKLPVERCLALKATAARRCRAANAGKASRTNFKAASEAHSDWYWLTRAINSRVCLLN